MKFYGWKNEAFAFTEALKYYRKLRYKKEERNKLIWEKTYAPKIKSFYNIHKGKDCFIIGNGPSLNKMNLEVLNDYYCFGMNKIYLIWDRVDLQFDYYVAVNSLVIEQSKKQIKSLKIPAFLNYNHSKEIPDKENIIKLDSGGLDGVFQQNMAAYVPEGYTVTYVALQLAFFMGFKNVYLVGMDHNFNQKGEPNEEQILAAEDANHFDPRYFKGQKWHLADLEGSELHYKIADFVYKRDGRMIYNATLGGNLDIFQRVDFFDALSRAKLK